MVPASAAPFYMPSPCEQDIVVVDGRSPPLLRVRAVKRQREKQMNWNTLAVGAKNKAEMLPDVCMSMCECAGVCGWK